MLLNIRKIITICNDKVCFQQRADAVGIEIAGYDECEVAHIAEALAVQVYHFIIIHAVEIGGAQFGT